MKMKLYSATSASSSQMTHKEEIPIWIIRYYTQLDSYEFVRDPRLIVLMLISNAAQYSNCCKNNFRPSLIIRFSLYFMYLELLFHRLMYLFKVTWRQKFETIKFFVKTKFYFHIHYINSNVWVEFFQYIVYRYLLFDKIFKSYKNVKYTSELESNKNMNINILHKSLNRFFTPNFLLCRSCKRIFLYFHFPCFPFLIPCTDVYLCILFIEIWMEWRSIFIQTHYN